jgi:transcriptional regulator with GAF, ATPase, and Fis domain
VFVMRSSSIPDFFDQDATVKIALGSAMALPLGALLRVVGVKAAPAELRLAAGKCTIGSGPRSHLVVIDQTVSRAHLELELVADGVAVRDLGSRNGTFHRGQRIERMVLGLGGRLTLGRAATLIVDPDTTSLEQGPANDRSEYRGILGASAAMRRVFAILTRLESSLLPVLVEGESGVGKELIARALHEGSRVARGPAVVVNCGAIPRELVSSELFGHRRGAFTGAVDARRGAFESADGGTLFLDEIGELPLEIQPMLLRALETGEVRAVGQDGVRHVKVRVVAATNRDLEQEVHEGRFREDLFYRLAVVRLKVPPLRERQGDIGPLANRFARVAGLGALPPDVVAELESRAWHGNARELRNAVDAYAALGVLPPSGRGRAVVIRQMASERVDTSRRYLELRDEVVEELSRAYLDAMLERTGGNQTAAARAAGVDRTYFGRLLAKYGRNGKG